MEFARLNLELRAFAAERDWDRFHSPKNLSMALSVEVAELVELFQWLSESESSSPSAELGRRVAEEIADIQIYLARLADKLGIDIDKAVSAKLEENKRKYPADRVRGKALKYTEFEGDPTE